MTAPVIKYNQVMRNGYFIESDFLPYVDSYEKECNKKVDVDIMYANIPNDSVLGAYYSYEGLSFLNYIAIDFEEFKSSGYFERELIIFHELGHHAGKNHVDDYTRLMNPVIMQTGYYINNRRDVINKFCRTKL